MTPTLFGIRHHGPGSARSLRLALTELKPDLILIEGPPDADSIISLAGKTQMQPPVAILVYAPEDPAKAVYDPFAEFSPEWQAIQFALANNIPARFMDLPAAHRLALTPEPAETVAVEPTATPESEAQADAHAEAGIAKDAPAEDTPAESSGSDHARADPLSLLAAAAGYSDGELWWEHMVEERRENPDRREYPIGVFAAIAQAMTGVREHIEALGQATPRVELLREATMRKSLRAAKKEGFSRIAVVCGAWHVPALQQEVAAKDDDALLKGLPKIKTVATWVPWTYGRLSYASGYGAGVKSPGWYHHLWRHPHNTTVQWLTRVARALREHGLDVSSAHVIEAVRLAESLASMRERSVPALGELNDATQSVILFGDALPMRLVHEQLIVGERLGQVPDDTPMTPLQQDLARQQKRLRVKPGASRDEWILDLRKENDLERSHLLHRLRLLDVPWGEGGERAKGKGTFKESWRVCWQPEFEIKLIEAGRYGNTVQQAAAAAVMQQARDSTELLRLAQLAHTVLLADLPQAIDTVIRALQAQTALATDIAQLMQAVPDLAQLHRYGDVRNTSVDSVTGLLEGMLKRICIGLNNACNGLNEEAAASMFERVQEMHQAVVLLEQDEWRAAWLNSLHQLMRNDGMPALLRGRCCRLLLESGHIDDANAATQLSLALSIGNDPAMAAAWIDGFLRDSGQLLVYDENLWNLIDAWVGRLSEDFFKQTVPLLRRTFGTFTAPERRQMGERVKRPAGASAKPAESRDNAEFDITRAQAALPILAEILGLTVTTYA